MNGAFSQLLAALGYDVTLHVGGVHGPDGPTPELMTNHLVLLVHGLPSAACPDGTWYVDAGLGDALHEPLPLVPGTYQQGPFEFRLEPSRRRSPIGSSTTTRSARSPAWCSAPRPPPSTVFAPRNVHLSTSPESGFVKTPTAQRRDADGVDILRGQVLHPTWVRPSAPGERSRPATSGSVHWRTCSTCHSTTCRRSNATRLWQRVHSVHCWHGRRRTASADSAQPGMSRVDEVGDRDGWRCWLCDEPVDPSMSVNDPRGPSVDSRTTDSEAEKKSARRSSGWRIAGATPARVR